METSVFIKSIVQPRFELCLNLMCGSKDKEYSRNGDKFHNFKIAAAMDGITPERALRGMWLKHLISIKDIIDDLDIGILPDQKILDEKITDNINYLLLLEGLIKERSENYMLKIENPERGIKDIIINIIHILTSYIFRIFLICRK